jgi:type II secretory pathway pseudopilin PulG
MKKSFTLFEMILVIVIVGIISLMIMRLTGSQLQKLQRKTEKDTLLTAYQNRYSKNLTSSLFLGTTYAMMQMTFATGANNIAIAYFTGEEQPFFTDSIQGDFQIEQIITNPNVVGNVQTTDTLTLTLKPYEIPCTLENKGNNLPEIILIIKMKKQKKYCFSISHKSCRMREVVCTSRRDPEYLPDFAE